MLLDKGCNEFVPSLHCNQNSIENLFSNFRMIGNDRTDVYGNVIIQQNVKQNIKMGKVSISSTSYDRYLQMESTNPQFYDSKKIDVIGLSNEIKRKKVLVCTMLKKIQKERLSLQVLLLCQLVKK